MVRHPKDVNKATSTDLKTTDIDGAQASSAIKHITNLATRNDVNKVTDIPGAQTGSLKKGMTSTRHLDPLWPSYTLPGHSEPGPVYTKNLRSSSTVKHGQTTSSAFGGKSDLISPVTTDQLQFKNTTMSEAVAIAAAERKSSGQRTPPPQKKANSVIARTGEEVLNTFDKSKDFGGKSEYVPARMSAYENLKPNLKTVSKPSGFTLETKVLKIVFDKFS